jgi:hypothetical protein
MLVEEKILSCARNPTTTTESFVLEDFIQEMLCKQVLNAAPEDRGMNKLYYYY